MTEVVRATREFPAGLVTHWCMVSHDYSFTGVLGAGMSGIVVTAEHRRTGEKAAMKSFRFDELSNAQIRDLEREVFTMSTLDHPNIAKVQAVYRSGRCLNVIIEHLSGGDVFKHIEDEDSITEQKAAAVIKQLLQAVEFLHERGIVHRDIKLENLVYESGRQDKVKLVDFGLCTFWQEGLDPLRRFCGTRTCLPPEVIRGAYTNKADMWCVGCAAYTLLTGENLIRNLELAPVYSRRFRHTSVEAQSFVTSLLAMDENLRLSAEEALKHSWICGAGSGEAAPLESGRKVVPVAEASTWSGGIHQEDTASRFSTTSRVQLRGIRGAIRQYPTEETGGTDRLQRAETSAWRPTLHGVTSRLASARRRLAAIFTTVRGSGPTRARAQAKATARVAPQTEEVRREVRGVVPHYSA